MPDGPIVLKWPVNPQPVLAAAKAAQKAALAAAALCLSGGLFAVDAAEAAGEAGEGSAKGKSDGEEPAVVQTAKSLWKTIRSA